MSQTNRKSITSPTRSNRACLCKDGKYHKDCCNGDLQNQGIGALNQGGDSITYNIVPRTLMS